ncbi:MAG: peptidoglycan DD-metalloendopeptidase family protein [Oscillochloris sp.]|nr:peptidoglycan DD-metalloendopeptidase family protein [Oscillochloris sp.]
MRRFSPLFVLLLLLPAFIAPPLEAARQPGTLGVQDFLAAQPGSLATYKEDGRSAAAIIEDNSLYYGLSPRLHLALLEAVSGLLSDPNPPPDRLDYPFGSAGPAGFGAQIAWASRELRAGFGPYERPPTLRFSDGLTITLTLDQAPEGVAVQRFLAPGRTRAEWQDLVARFGDAFTRYFNNELIELDPSASGPAAPAMPGDGFLLRPWPAGTNVVHLAYFDHAYPTVDSGDDGNGFVVNYRGQGNVQYDGHDGHDYYFPDQPIGTPILAAAAGIAYARDHRGKGVVIVHPGGYETVYWHLDDFAPVFSGLVGLSQGLPVQAGDLLGYSGKTGFVQGTPHLHFEVRHYGRQVDPYGWQGAGPDPCLAYAGCAASRWLWHGSISGSDDFQPPSAVTPALPPDSTPPIATLSINPPESLRLQLGFDEHVVPTVGRGFPTIAGEPRFVGGQFDQALHLDRAGITYQTDGNLDPQAGTIALWANVPAEYPQNSLDRHYILAASANPDDKPVYSGTLTLRRDLLGPDAAAQWTFWTVGGDAAVHDSLSVPDTLAPGWHHFAISWDRVSGRKLLFIDGKLAAAKRNIPLPATVGPTLQLGRFTYGGAPAGIAVDDLRIYNQPLPPTQIVALAQLERAAEPPPAISDRSLRLDTNAIDREGGIVAVQLGLDGEFADPQPYYDSYRWQLPDQAGTYTLAARFFDRAGNSSVVSQTIELVRPPQASVDLTALNASRAMLIVNAEGDQAALEMQISASPVFREAQWHPLIRRSYWMWAPDQPQQLYIRLRDANGIIGPTVVASTLDHSLHLPYLVR